MRYHHIVFDVDGTLLDTEEAILQSFQKTLREHAGIEKDLSELSFCLGITGAAALKRLETGHEEEILLQWKENLAALRDFVRVFDGIELLLKRLRADGFQLGPADAERSMNGILCDWGSTDTLIRSSARRTRCATSRRRSPWSAI